MSQDHQSGRCDFPAGDGLEVAGDRQKLSDAEIFQTNVPDRDDAALIALEIALEGATDERTRELIREALQSRLATLEREPTPATPATTNVLEGP